MPAKTHYIFVFFGIYTHSGPASFFHSFAISIIECEHNRKLMIASCVFFLEFVGIFLFQPLFQMPFCSDFCLINKKLSQSFTSIGFNK